MSKTITLPKSGIVLEKDARSLVLLLPSGLGWISHSDATDEVAFYLGDTHSGTRDECIAWLDARVLELRAALLPADARERVARALFEAEWRDVNREDWPEYDDEARAAFSPEVDAVIAALGGQP